jgi:hypothetical protein
MDFSLKMDTLQVMLRQEDSYVTGDYLHQQREPETANGPLHHVDANCREMMATWAYSVIDYCDFQRETVEVSMSCLDRFLLTEYGRSALEDRDLFQLAAMTTVYTAVKLHETAALDLDFIAHLSRGAYSQDMVETMEETLLYALKWRVNPPTALAFVRQYLELLPCVDERVRQSVYEVARFQTELAVKEYWFLTVKASALAYCALLNALESHEIEDRILNQAFYVLEEVTGLAFHCGQISTIRNRLLKALSNQPVSEQAQQASYGNRNSRKFGRWDSFEDSPRSVSVHRKQLDL